MNRTLKSYDPCRMYNAAETRSVSLCSVGFKQSVFRLPRGKIMADTLSQVDAFLRSWLSAWTGKQLVSLIGLIHGESQGTSQINYSRTTVKTAFTETRTLKKVCEGNSSYEVTS